MIQEMDFDGVAIFVVESKAEGRALRMKGVARGVIFLPEEMRIVGAAREISEATAMMVVRAKRIFDGSLIP